MHSKQSHQKLHSSKLEQIVTVDQFEIDLQSSIFTSNPNKVHPSYLFQLKSLTILGHKEIMKTCCQKLLDEVN